VLRHTRHIYTNVWVCIFFYYECKSRIHLENQLKILTIIHIYMCIYSVFINARAVYIWKTSLQIWHAFIPSKEPYIPSKETYIPSKEPYILSKEPCTHFQKLTNLACIHEFVYLENITYYVQNCLRKKIVYAKNISLHFWALESDMHSWICTLFIWYLNSITYYVQNYLRKKIVDAKKTFVHI